MKPVHFIIINLIVTSITLGALGASMWLIGMLEDSNTLIAIMIALSMLPLLVLMDAQNPQSEYRRLSWASIGLMILSWFFLVITFGIRYDLTFLTWNGLLLLVSLPWLLLCWFIAARNRLVLAGLITHAVALLAYLLIPASLTDERLDVFLIPLPVLSVVGVLWALFLSRSMACTVRTRHRPLMGPGIESFTMFMLVVPLVLLARLITDVFTTGEDSVTLISIVIGLVFSGAIATPFRQFLRALGGLDKSRELDSPEPHRPSRPPR